MTIEHATAPSPRTWKLSEEQVIDIYSSGEPPKVVASRYGITHTTVSLIRSRQRHVRVTKWLPRP